MAVECLNSLCTWRSWGHFKFTKDYYCDSKSICSLCQKSYTCVDRRMKLTTSELKNHLLLDHSSNPSVCAAYLLDEAQKMVNVTPRQCITKYAKATSKQEGHMDHYIRGSYHDVNLNRALVFSVLC